MELDFGMLADPALRADPYPVYHQLREASPVPALDGKLVLLGRYADCMRVLRDPAASSDRANSLLALPEMARFPRSFLFLDPPDHTRLRRLVSKAFSPRMVSALRPRIETIAAELLTAATRNGRLDVVADLAYPLPVRVICELLGVPPDDRELFSGWSTKLTAAVDPTVLLGGGSLDEIIQARTEFGVYFRGLIDQRRTRSGDDLLSYLVRVEEDGDQLSEDELLVTCVLLLVAGHETTVNLIANAILALLRNPEQLAALRADPALAAGAVEETLRYDAPVQLTSRIARGGMRLGEVQAPDGGVVMLLLAAANRDPQVWTDPDRFDIRRPDAHAHLAFASGPHFCLGAALARVEGEIALNAFARRVADPELDEDSVIYKPNVNLRGPAQLLVNHRGVRGNHRGVRGAAH